MTLPLIYAGMMELVDMRDLGSRAATRWGSSPHTRIKARKRMLDICFRTFLNILMGGLYGNYQDANSE